MRRVLWMGAVVLAVAAAVWITGIVLPARHTITVSRVVRGGPEQVWTVITDVEGFPAWRPEVERVERLQDEGGRMVWREHSSGGPMTLRVSEWTPFHRWSARIADEDLGFGGSWTWELVARPSGTEVTVTEDGEVSNPFLRVVARLFMDEEESVTTYLDALEDRMAEGG